MRRPIIDNDGTIHPVLALIIIIILLALAAKVQDQYFR